MTALISVSLTSAGTTLAEGNFKRDELIALGRQLGPLLLANANLAATARS